MEAGILERIRDLVLKGEVKISEHGYEELAADGLYARDMVEALPEAELLEEYPGYPKGPCVLVLEIVQDVIPVHAVWGIPRGKDAPAVLVTAYSPDPLRWSEDFRRRKQ